MRWLHISDLHIGPDGLPAEVEALMNRFLKDLKSKLSDEPVDCIIFTGDLFNRGAWTSSQTTDAQAILKDIYRECSLAGGWEWTDTEPMTRLFYCPGNHDVLREAYRVSKNNHVLHRKNLVSTPANILSNGQLSTSDDNYLLLTQGTFGQFDTAMKDLCGNDTYISDYEYEYRIFEILDGENKFSFIGVNTALLAAQEFDSDDVAQELQNALTEFHNYHSTLNTQKALNAYKKYDTAVNKKLGTIKNDKNNLCFISAQAQQAIQTTRSKNSIPILFGHHPISFLSEEAAGKVCINAEKNEIPLYLCGHMHKPHGESVRAPYETCLGKLSKESNVYQVTVGGLFLDPSGYNEMSYSIGELTCVRPDQLLLNVSVFVYAKDVFGNLDWQTTNKTETIPINKRTQDAECDKDEHKVNIERSSIHDVITSNHYVTSDDENDKEKNEHSSTIQSDKDFRAKLLTNLNLSDSEKKGG